MDLHYDIKSLQKQNQEASRRQILDWLIYHCPLYDTRLYTYPFRIVFHSKSWIHTSHVGMFISYIGETPWQCYKHAAAVIFADKVLRKKFLKLYYKS